MSLQSIFSREIFFILSIFFSYMTNKLLLTAIDLINQFGSIIKDRCQKNIKGALGGRTKTTNSFGL